MTKVSKAKQQTLRLYKMAVTNVLLNSAKIINRANNADVFDKKLGETIDCLTGVMTGFYMDYEQQIKNAVNQK